MNKLLFAVCALTLCCCATSEKPTDNLTTVVADSIGTELLSTQNEITKPVLLISGIPNDIDSLLKRLSPKERKQYINHMTKFYRELEETSNRAYAETSARIKR
jgi:hypothetical protein